MRFSTIIFSAVAVLSVSAQSASTTLTPAISGAAPEYAAQTSEAACLAAFNNTTCAAACVAGDVMVNGIAACQSNCAQGDGSASANLAYKNCLTACEDVVTSTSTTATATQAPGSSSTSVAPASTTSKAGSSSNMENVRVGASLAGVIGIFFAFFFL